MTNIYYVSALNGGIEMTTENGTTLWSDTVEGVARAMQEHGIASPLMGSSTMDFASEEGFDSDDGANLMLKRVFELI